MHLPHPSPPRSPFGSHVAEKLLKRLDSQVEGLSEQEYTEVEQVWAGRRGGEGGGGGAVSGARGGRLGPGELWRGREGLRQLSWHHALVEARGAGRQGRHTRRALRQA